MKVTIFSRDQSHSPDSLVEVRIGGDELRVQEQVKRLPIFHLLTSQVKEGAQEFTLGSLADEIAKADVSRAAVLIIFSRSLGVNLGKLCTQNGGLVIGPRNLFL